MIATRVLLGLLLLSLAANGVLGYRAFLPPEREAANAAPGATASNLIAGLQKMSLEAGDALQMPVIPFSDRDGFRAFVDGDPSSWSPFIEYPVVGRILPAEAAGSRAVLAAAPEVPATVDGIAQLLRWYTGCQWNTCAEAFADVLRPLNAITDENREGVVQYCNDLVSVMRTLLLSRGIVSRPVDFEFKDAYGKSSHTFLEAWAEDEGKWVYVDPFYKAYARRSVAELVESKDLDAVVFLEPAADEKAFADPEAQRDGVARLFADGWHLWSVSNGLTGIRAVYLDPAFYGTNLSDRPDVFGPFSDDLRF